jgi:thioesterase domain-containing protein
MTAPVLPPLISVRGWSVEDDPRYPAFVEHLQASGVVVEDLWVPPDGFATMADWAAAVIVELDRRAHPLHLIGYCLGGHVLWEATSQLEAAGRPPAYIGLIDCWYQTPAVRLDRGIYGRYAVSWSRRARQQAGRVAPPRQEAPSSIVRSWFSRAGRTAARTLRGRSHARRRPGIRNWHGQHLAYNWQYPRLRTVLHLYNADETAADHDDPSLGLSIYLNGGFTVDLVAGTDHKTCLDGAARDTIAAAIARDRLPIT